MVRMFAYDEDPGQVLPNDRPPILDTGQGAVDNSCHDASSEGEAHGLEQSK